MYGSTPSISSGSSEYGDDSYGDNAGQKCYPTYETKYKEQCESYNEKVCRTSHTEQCKDVAGRNVRLFILRSKKENVSMSMNCYALLKKMYSMRKFLLCSQFRSVTK